MTLFQSPGGGSMLQYIHLTNPISKPHTPQINVTWVRIVILHYQLGTKFGRNGHTVKEFRRSSFVAYASLRSGLTIPVNLNYIAAAAPLQLGLLIPVRPLLLAFVSISPGHLRVPAGRCIGAVAITLSPLVYTLWNSLQAYQV